MSDERQGAGRPPNITKAVNRLVRIPKEPEPPIGRPGEIPKQLARLEEVVDRVEKAAAVVVEVFSPVLTGDYPPSACTEQPEAVSPIGGLIQRLVRQLSGCAETLEITVGRAAL